MVALVLALAIALSPTSGHTLVVLGDDAVHTKPPRARDGSPAFAYWNHVVALGAYSGVYLGERWILTAGHVGSSDVTIEGCRYRVDPTTEIDLRTDFYPADLVLFRVRKDPGLATLPLSGTRPEPGNDALLLGWGRASGDVVEWKGRSGRKWSEGPPRLRWGRNRIHRVGVHSGLKGFVTETFGMRFDFTGGPRGESQASQGDSGGAVFLRGERGWELGGVLLMIRRRPGQPGHTAIAGNETFAADLAYYREQIEAITGLR